jgi:hypothetical protein
LGCVPPRAQDGAKTPGRAVGGFGFGGLYQLGREIGI